MRIWDIHCHPEGPRVPGRTLTEKVENLLEISGRMGIERFGLFLRPGNDEKEILSLLDRYRDKLFAFLWMSLWSETVESNIAQLNRWIVDGPMVGMKIAGTDGICSLKVYEPIFEHAAKLEAGIFIHAWYKVGGEPALPGGVDEPHESKPRDVAELAARHPAISFICGHSGGDWELGFRAVRACKNVLVETSGSFPTRGMVEMAVRELGAERIIYGSDISGRGFASQLAKVWGADILDREKELIFSGNLRRLLTPMFQRKGMKL